MCNNNNKYYMVIYFNNINKKLNLFKFRFITKIDVEISVNKLL